MRAGFARRRPRGGRTSPLEDARDVLRRKQRRAHNRRRLALTDNTENAEMRVIQSVQGTSVQCRGDERTGRERARRWLRLAHQRLRGVDDRRHLVDHVAEALLHVAQEERGAWTREPAHGASAGRPGRCGRQEAGDGAHMEWKWRTRGRCNAVRVSKVGSGSREAVTCWSSLVLGEGEEAQRHTVVSLPTLICAPCSLRSPRRLTRTGCSRRRPS